MDDIPVLIDDAHHIVFLVVFFGLEGISYEDFGVVLSCDCGCPCYRGGVACVFEVFGYLEGGTEVVACEGQFWEDDKVDGRRV